MAFICGSLHNQQQEEDFEVLWPFSPTPLRKRHSFCCRSNKLDKNPYANRGLDKFEALMADIDNKKQKIFTQKGSEDISFVRFVYSNSNDIKPIIVKLKDQRKHEKDHQKNLKTTSDIPKIESPPLDQQKVTRTEHPTAVVAREEVKKSKINRFDEWKWDIEKWWKPSFYVPFFVILIMVSLAFFGRSFAILCTSLGWYLVPTINATLENSKTKIKTKKNYSRLMSENKIITSPRSVLNRQMNDNYQPHRKSF